MHSFVALLALPLAACVSSVPWRPLPPTTPSTWRHCQAFDGPAATILAADEVAAANLHELATALGADLQRAAEQPPPRGLWIAVGIDDPLVVADGDACWRLYQAWHRRLLDNQLAAPVGTNGRAGAPAPEIDSALLVHLTPSPAPPDAAELTLLPQLLTGVDYVVLVPTDAGLAAGADRLFEAMRVSAGISSLQVFAMAAVGRHPVDHLRQQFTGNRSRILAMTALAALRLPPAGADLARGRLGLPAVSNPDDPLAPLTPELAERAAKALANDYRWPPPATAAGPHLNLSVGPRPDQDLRRVLASGPWQVVVDLGVGQAVDFAQQLAAHGHHYVRIDERQLLPGRASIDQLAAVCRDHPSAFILVTADDEVQAALLVAAYAFHHRGCSVATAIDLANHYGAAGMRSLLEPTLVRPEPGR